jgi:hypothetical protein
MTDQTPEARNPEPAAEPLALRLNDQLGLAPDEPVDDYGNPLSGDRTIYCCFPDCGCASARLCMAEKGASVRAEH